MLYIQLTQVHASYLVRESTSKLASPYAECKEACWAEALFKHVRVIRGSRQGRFGPYWNTAVILTGPQ